MCEYYFVNRKRLHKGMNCLLHPLNTYYIPPYYFTINSNKYYLLENVSLSVGTYRDFMKSRNNSG